MEKETKKNLNLEELKQKVTEYNVDKQLKVSIDWDEDKKEVRMKQEEVYVIMLDDAVKLKGKIPETTKTVAEPVIKKFGKHKKGWRITIWLD